MAKRRCYVVTAPEAIRGIYVTWDSCRAAVRGARGARYQAVDSRAEAEALLSGKAVTLAPGLFAFTDGNHFGGVGLVLVRVDAKGDHETRDFSRHVAAILVAAGLDLDAAAELDRIRQVLAELAALLMALLEAPEGETLTVIHDYEGVGAWMMRRWQTKDPTVRLLVERARAIGKERGLTLRFERQAAHRSAAAGRNDRIAYNARADELARAASR
jgi:hypothetical protein